MVADREDDILDSICRTAKSAGRLTGDGLTKLYEVFGQRFAKAFEALKENRVKKYIFKPSGRVVWIVVGKERDYLIMPDVDFCTCDDFYFRVLDRQVHMCYHVLAQKMAKALEWYETVEGDDELYETLMKEWTKPTP
ncbi:MAG: hypothetical protein N3F10_06790 [Candidatus Bathyarchaeota archaeon]|nr:hypothetical protein [Candidatus Bathyarchaeota archaeon]MCX8177980.1 hypothetical protein [Candidatus Bathyarchaeota archaeon]MDW8194538.1 hypothetical protein [Nitrososphaerota archaeon]